MQKLRVQSLVGELRSHMPHSQKNQNKTEAILKQIQYRLFKKWPTSKNSLKKNNKKLCIYWNVFWLRVTSGLVNGGGLI